MKAEVHLPVLQVLLQAFPVASKIIGNTAAGRDISGPRSFRDFRVNNYFIRLFEHSEI